MIAHRAFFGDAEHSFCLTDPMIAELEASTGTAIGVLFQRLVAQAFRLSDLSEIIRLGLIGAGTAPAIAERLVATYAKDRPLAEVLPLALDVITARWLGTEEAQANG